MNNFIYEFFQKTRPVQFSEKAKSVINAALSMSYLRQIIPYNADLLTEYIPNKTYLLYQDTKNSLYELGNLQKYKGESPLTWESLPQSNPDNMTESIYNQFIIDCAYASSKLEGNSCTLEDVERYRNNGSFGSYSKKEETMIFNHFVALDSIISNEYMNYNPFTLKVIHGELSTGLSNDNFAGKIRDVTISIPDSNYKPLHEEQQIKKQLPIILEKAARIIDPYEQSFFLLTFITYLLPFLDYNNMVARVMANLPLIKNNLCPLTYLLTEKEDYTKAVLALYELHDTLPLQELYKSMYEHSVLRYLSIPEQNS